MGFLSTELETKRILFDIFKEKQQKSAEAGAIPSFYKKVSILIVSLEMELLQTVCPARKKH